MGKPTQEILKTPDLDTEAPFIALQHKQTVVVMPLPVC